MKTQRAPLSVMVVALLTTLAVLSPATAQRRRFGGPRITSPEVSADGKITFRLQAQKAETVQLSGSDLPEIGRGLAMTKDPNGIWEVTVGPVEPGAYRYNFNVDGVSVVDPRNSSISESNMNVWSLVYVPGSDFMDTKDVPHGAVAEVTYY